MNICSLLNLKEDYDLFMERRMIYNLKKNPPYLKGETVSK